jgi:hypothetical protein
MPAFYPEGDEPKLADPSGRSLHKINNLLKSIDAKTGSTTITGPVTVSNEVEVTNSTGNPIPVSGTVGLDSTSLAALENISVTFPATQNVNVTNAGLSVSVSNLPATQPVSGSVSVSNFPATQPVSLASVPSHPVTGTFWQATQPVSLASAPVTPVTDNGGSLTVDGTVTVNDMTSGNAKTKIVDSAGADVSYIPAGTAGTPSASVLSVQGISGGTGVNTIPNAQAIKAGIFAFIDDEGPIPVIDSVVDSIKDNLGFQDSTAATSDTGTFSISSLIKRGLQNWTSLLAKIPALVSGRIPVDGSGVTQPVSGTITAAQATAANLNATVVGSGSFTAAQATAANLNATVVQGTATNLKTQAEVYQGGSAVGSSNQLFVKTNTTYGGNAPIVVPGFFQSGLNNYLGVSDGSGLPIRPANSTTFSVTGTFWQATQPVSGTFWQATQPVSGTVTINNSQGATVTQSTFFSTTASTSLVAASANRKTLTVFNEGAGMLYVSVGSTCTTTAYQVRLSSGDYWECPLNQTSLAHTAVFATAGNARVTEVV